LPYLRVGRRSVNRNVKELSLDELAGWLSSRGEPPYRAKQIFQWLYRKGVDSFAAMSDLSKELRSLLERSFAISRPRVVRLARATDGTKKFLFELADGARIESVLIPAEVADRLTLCISSQVGCGMGCAFCATATLGLKGSLASHEIVDQVLEARRGL